MNRKSGSGSGVFLMEMMVVVFFFIICASTCILAFVKADNMSRLASGRNQAVSAAESIAEVWKLEGMEGVKVRMEAREISGESGRSDTYPAGSFIVYWDRNWQPLAPGPEGEQTGEIGYTAYLQESEAEDGVKKLSIHVQEGERVAEGLFDLEVHRCEGLTGGGTDGKL